MRKIVFAAATAVTLMISTGAMAQGVGIGVGPGGVSVGVNDGHRHYHDHGPRYRTYDRDYDRRDWRRSRAETVIIKERRPRKVVREYIVD